MAADEPRRSFRGRAHCGLCRADIGDGAPLVARLQHGAHLAGELADGNCDHGELGARQRLAHRLRDVVDCATLRSRLRDGRVFVEAGHSSPTALRGQADRGADQARPDNSQPHDYPICLPIRATSPPTSRANAANSSVGSCCGPSQRASSGRGWASTMIPSAPTATAARANGNTNARRPAACEGSTITGRCVSSFKTATEPRSSVYRSELSNVLIPRSHRMIRSFPSLATYSAAINSSSTEADGP